jgi:2,3-bisphosphoglycerate-independent phosphoglycerate mutase
VITDADGKPCGTVEDDDAVVLFNFRSDRMVELSKAFEYTEEGKFNAFDRERVPKARSIALSLCAHVMHGTPSLADALHARAD